MSFTVPTLALVLPLVALVLAVYFWVCFRFVLSPIDKFLRKLLRVREGRGE